MGDILSQKQIDELIIAFNNGIFREWEMEHNIASGNRVRFKCNNIYAIEDYELFYCNYILEELTACSSILRRYAYRDTESFKQFSYFIVLEDYQDKGINAVSVVGVLLSELVELEYNYHYNRENGIVYLVDASSLYYV